MTCSMCGMETAVLCVCRQHDGVCAGRSHNGLVLDPVQEEIRRHYVNVWSDEEKQVRLAPSRPRALALCRSAALPQARLLARV